MNSGNSDILEIFALVSSASARARRAAEARLRLRGLTYAQYSALAVLILKDGLSQAELAHALETDSTTAMVLRGSLEKKRLVDRKADPTDARIRRIVLTNAGKSLVSQVKPEIAALFAQGRALFSDADIKKLGSLLEKLRSFAHSILPVPEEPEGGKRRPGRPRKADATPKSKSPKKLAKKSAAAKKPGRSAGSAVKTSVKTTGGKAKVQASRRAPVAQRAARVKVKSPKRRG
jgi:MarR family transcriptional regulator for hemolysin